MESIDTVVICAAGTGTRLGVGVPKCLVSVAGRSIIDWQLDLLEEFDDLRIVVGFREQDVYQHVVRRRPDAIFVRNPHYATTSTLDSLRLAAPRSNRPFIALDGDLLVHPESFKAFSNACVGDPPIIGITKSSTDEAVFVRCSDGNELVVTEFHRDPVEDYEWSGPAFVNSDNLYLADGHVYQSLERLLPLKAVKVKTAEVDTPDDLARARSVMERWLAD